MHSDTNRDFVYAHNEQLQIKPKQRFKAKTKNIREVN